MKREGEGRVGDIERQGGRERERQRERERERGEGGRGWETEKYREGEKKREERERERERDRETEKERGGGAGDIPFSSLSYSHRHFHEFSGVNHMAMANTADFPSTHTYAWLCMRFYICRKGLVKTHLLIKQTKKKSINNHPPNLIQEWRGI